MREKSVAGLENKREIFLSFLYKILYYPTYELHYVYLIIWKYS